MAKSEEPFGQTMASPGPRDAAAIRAAEAAVSLDWNVGDVILDLYEVRPIKAGREPHYVEGGFGRVYRMHHRGWNLDLAVKVPREDRFKTEAQRDEFTRECETWVNLGLHPNTVSCHYVRRLGPLPVVFAEFVEGGSLRDWIDNRRAYEGDPKEALKRILDIAIQIAWGLRYAHDQGLVHQDVKPANVMMTPEGVAKVTDFGLAKARTGAGEPATGDSQQSILVSSGGMTPAYCSPEQANKQPLSRKTDIWSWGLSVLEMFAGGIFWQAGQVAPEALESHLENGPEDASIPKMPQGVADLLRQCFQRNPDDRPKDMQEVAGSLREIYQMVTGGDYARMEPKAAALAADDLNNRAVTLLDLGKTEAEAEKIWLRALEIEAKHPESTYNRGLLMWRSGRMSDEELLRATQMASASGSERSGGRCLLGLVQVEKGDYAEAVKTLESLASDSVDRQMAGSALLIAKERTDSTRTLIRTFENQSQQVMALSFTPDGRYILSGGFTHLTLLEVATGQCILFQGLKHQVTSLCLSPDGRHVLSGGGATGISSPGEMILWDCRSARPIRSFEGHLGNVNTVCFSSDGRYALSAGADGSVRQWDAATGECLRTLPDRYLVQATCLGGASPYAFLGSREQKLVELWDIAAGKPVLTLGVTTWVQAACLTGDGRHALTVGQATDYGLPVKGDLVVKVWDSSNGQCLQTMPMRGHLQFAESMCFATDCRYVLTGSRDYTVRLWESYTGRCLSTLKGHTHYVTAVSLSRDGRYAISGGADGTIRFWLAGCDQDPTPAPYLLARTQSSEKAASAGLEYGYAMLEAREALAHSDPNRAARLLRKARAQSGCQRRPEAITAWRNLYSSLCRTTLAAAWEERTLDLHTGSVQSVAIFSDGERALTAGRDDLICLWDLTTGRCLQNTHAHMFLPGMAIGMAATLFWVASADLSADGQYAISGGRGDLVGFPSNGATLRLWDLSKFACTRTFGGYGGNITAVSLSRDGRFALSGREDGEAVLWDAAAGRRLRVFHAQANGITAVSLSGNGRHAISAGNRQPTYGFQRSQGGGDTTIRVWDLAAGTCVRSLTAHTDTVRSVGFSPCGRYVVSAGNDRRLILWDVGSGRAIRTFEGHADDVTAASWLLDGRYLVSGSADCMVKVWAVADGRCLATLDGHTSAVLSVCISPDGRYVLSGGADKKARLWFLDWELEDRDTADWDERARQHLVNFLSLHTPCVGSPTEGGTPTDEEVRLALMRQGQPIWTDADFTQLLRTLGCAGYGWLRPEGVKRELEKMAADWQGPPPLPWESA